MIKSPTEINMGIYDNVQFPNKMAAMRPWKVLRGTNSCRWEELEKKTQRKSEILLNKLVFLPLFSPHRSAAEHSERLN